MINTRMPAYNQLFNNQNVPESAMVRGDSESSSDYSMRVLASVDDDANRIIYGSKMSYAFSRKIVTHGVWQDNSMAAMTRKRTKEQVNMKRRANQVERLNNNFNQEVEIIKKIQQDLILKQKSMADIVIKKYSAIMIQSFYRRYKSRVLLHKLKCRRFIKTWVYYRCVAKKRLRARKVIIKQYRNHKFRSTLDFLLYRIKCVRRLQRFFRNTLAIRSARKVYYVKIMTRKTVENIILLSSSRAVRHIKALLKSDEDKIMLSITKLLMHYRRRKRREYLKSEHGKVLLYIFWNLSISGKWMVVADKKTVMCNKKAVRIDYSRCIVMPEITSPKASFSKNETTKETRRGSARVSLPGISDRSNLPGLTDIPFGLQSLLAATVRPNDVPHDISKDIMAYIKRKVNAKTLAAFNATHGIGSFRRGERERGRRNNVSVAPPIVEISETAKLIQEHDIDTSKIPIPMLPSIITGSYNIKTFEECAWFILDLLECCMQDNSLIDGVPPLELITPLLQQKRTKEKTKIGQKNAKKSDNNTSRNKQRSGTTIVTKPAPFPTQPSAIPITGKRNTLGAIARPSNRENVPSEMIVNSDTLTPVPPSQPKSSRLSVLKK